MGFGLHAGWAIEGAVGKREKERKNVYMCVCMCVCERD